nr:Gag-Pol polyprotein [Tanacetum cinerariifolium]
MSTQQDIYAAGSENRPPMLNKENYVPWSSRLLRFAKSRPNRKFIHNSLINGPYVRRMIPEPGDTNRKVPEKKAKLFNEWERFTSNDWESIDSYYHRFLKLMNDLKRNKHFLEKIANELKAKRLAKTQDPLALMATSNNPYNFPVLNQDQPSVNQNYMQQPIPNHEDITDPTTIMNMALTLMAKAFKLNYLTPTNNNQRISSNPRNRQIAQLGIQLQDEEFDLMATAVDLDEIEKVNTNCILMANLQQASTSEEQYTELFEPIPESHQVPQNDNDVIYEVTSVEQSRGILEQHPVNVKETRALHDSLYQDLAIEVEKVNTVKRKLKETNAELTTELARFKN